MSSIPVHALDLVQAALLASFWRHEALRRFLRRHHISENALSHLTKDITKRQYLDWLFPQLEGHEKGAALIRSMARSLSEQRAFPDLEGWEDSTHKKTLAQQRVAELRDYLDREAIAVHDEKERKRLREEAAARRSRNQTHAAALKHLKDDLEKLVPAIGTQRGGYKFQDWFGELARLFELPYKKSYRTPDGREVDGSITINGMTYLLSLKFTGTATEPGDISEFRGRLAKVADFTMGIFVSITGYSTTAVAEASGAGMIVLLIDHSHLYYTLQGLASFSEVITRLREHASRTGQATLSINDFR